MRQLTQTSLDPGNCWQTCVACILDIEPTLLPDQTQYDRRVVRDDGKIEWVGKSYGTVLNAYLRKHHGLAYWQMHVSTDVFGSAIQPAPGRFHMLTGRTVRSATNGGQRHVVVGREGTLFWDPHPSRAGLTDEIEWAFLVPFPKSWEKFMDEACACPACGGSR